MEPITKIQLCRISADPQLQPRVAGVDHRHVKDLEKAAECWPPLKLVIRGDRYLLVDGYHRYAAAQNLKLQTVPAEVIRVSETEDLHALAFALNAAHGRPLTLSDRRAFAARLLCSNPDCSDREIARRSGLVQPTVAKIRHDLEEKARIQPSNVRVGRDGRKYAVATHNGLKSWAGLIGDIVDAVDTNEQRRIVRYLQKLVPSLEEQDKLKGFETLDDAARACIAVLGEKPAKELAEQIGWSSRNIYGIACALGYRHEDQL